MNFFNDFIRGMKISYFQGKMKSYSKKIKKATIYNEEISSWYRLRDYYVNKFNELIDQDEE